MSVAHGTVGGAHTSAPPGPLFQRRAVHARAAAVLTTLSEADSVTRAAFPAHRVAPSAGIPPLLPPSSHWFKRVSARCRRSHLFLFSFRYNHATSGPPSSLGLLSTLDRQRRRRPSEIEAAAALFLTFW
jgi:hypothetical protein